MDLSVAQIVALLTFLTPMVLGILVGALIMSIITRRDHAEEKEVIISTKFRNGMIFNVKCKQKSEIILCPLCGFKNRNPYRMSKHLKGHFKKDEGKDLFLH